ncbi:acyl-CoA dehydrogenase family protein [Oceanicola sp. 22II-s10i]|uniref:acyl-CoA dehydrogenase family protein n=1 Tax=Oceanicola sp. 22II-s10i TaxID=1317116 RepID=UPI000B52302B|nr:acyl-CoA dehydrogenase family protein [Oceanicola sp. 22II-s10i]
MEDLTAVDLNARLTAFMHAEIFPRVKEMKQFVAENPPGARPAFMADLKSRARAQGLWNMGLPNLPDWAPGTRLTNIEFAPMAETLGWVDWAAEVFNCHAPDLPTMEMLVSIGTEAQKDTWLKPMLEGQVCTGFSMTEPDTASSDARNIRTRIEDMGDHWLVNGHKWFTGNSGVPGWAFTVLIGVSDPEAAPYARHSALIVPVDLPGVNIVRDIPVLGFSHRSRPNAEVVFDNVRVPKENLLGERGKGFVAAQVRLATARIHHCMRSIGGAELMLALMCERAGQRETFGSRIAEHGKVQEFVAHSRVELEQARLLVLNAARALDEKGGKGAQAEISMIKLAVARACYEVADRAVQVFGAMGMTDDSPAADFLAAMRALRIYDGPDEVHVRTIARHEFAAQSAAYPDGLMQYFCTDFSDRSRWRTA